MAEQFAQEFMSHDDVPEKSTRFTWILLPVGL